MFKTMRDTVVEGTGNFDRVGFFNAHLNGSTVADCKLGDEIRKFTGTGWS